MSLYGSAAEQALHCLLYLTRTHGEAVSAADLAEFQGISPSFLAKLMTKLKQAGIVEATEGVSGGFRLRRAAETVTVLEVVDAVEGRKPLFRCKDIRLDCVLFEGNPPAWASGGVCEIHAVMLEAEHKMRRSLAAVTVADIAAQVNGKVPAAAREAGVEWFRERRRNRGISSKVS